MNIFKKNNSSFDIKPKRRYDVILYSIFVVAIISKFILFYSQIEVPICGRSFLPAWIYCLATSFILSLPYFIFRKRLSVFILIFLFLLDILLIVNIAYYRYYANVIPIFSYGQIGNLKDFKSGFGGYFRLQDGIYLLTTAIVYVVYLLFRKYLKGFTKKQRIIIPCSIFLIFTILVCTDLYSFQKNNDGPLSRKFLKAKVLPNDMVSSYGLITLWIYQLHEYYSASRNPMSEEEKNGIENFIIRREAYTTPIVKTEMEAKNLILLIVESLSSWAIDYDNGQATPFLRGLTQDDEVIYVRNVIPQTSHSRSADAQVLYNTGLSPTFNGSITTLYVNQYYPSLAEALREKDNYYSLSVMGHRKQVWNQQTMNMIYHFDELISKENLAEEEIIGGGISDESLYRQTINILKDKQQIPEPYYLQLISASSHDGIDFANRESDINFPQDLPKDIKYYIKSIEYVDKTIKKFINDLKSNDMYDNSIIVIIGDHEGMNTWEIENDLPELVSETEKSTTFIPLFILNGGMKTTLKSDAVIGAIDIYPTLLDLMGLDQYFWRGLGGSIFSTKPPTGSIDMLHNVYDTDISDDRNLYLRDMLYVSNLIISKKYFEAIKNKN